MTSAAPMALRAGARRAAALLRGLLLAGGLVGAGAARPAVPPDDGCVRVPFAQQVDMGSVNALARAQPQELLALIAGLRIDVLRVPSAHPARPANPLLAELPVAHEQLLQQAGFRDSYEGRSLPAGTCCGLERATVLIRDTASSYTLLHEVLHLLIVPADGIVLRADLETRFALAFHRLNVYQRRLYDDPSRLLNPLWRRDIAAALHEAASLLFDRLRIGQSQEAIVERVLAGCIDERSPYFDAGRRAEGRRYGEAMVDNAVDVFNVLHAAVEFCDAEVRQLRADLVAGHRQETPGTSLSAREQQAFAAELHAVREELARVRAEIESLKRFQSR
ncbi:hypothetical protein [Piscinibacter defluvii]|uniref:hypothetical protein n=1 Tax=Piscinibacter defluvii TaxID=1796922 RepID=UPI000FDF46AE|nr:hypothetical protein [Piscinibacter defluvii]